MAFKMMHPFKPLPHPGIANLAIFARQYRRRGRAFKGYKGLLPYLKHKGNEKKEKQLAWLLRHHDEGTVRGKEVEFRDNTDFLIGFYNMLFVGVVAKYFPLTLTYKLRAEIRHILSNKAVRTYYVEHYPLMLSDMVLQLCEMPNLGEGPVAASDEKILFESFLLLINSVRDDEDVEQFQWFLDAGSTDDYNIYDLIRLLKDQKKLKYKIANDDEGDILESGIKGFAKYVDFLQEYRYLIQKAAQYPNLQWAIYYYNSYWFDKLGKYMDKVFMKALENINTAISACSEEHFIEKSKEVVDRNPDRPENAPTQFGDWKLNSQKELQEISDCFIYLRNFNDPKRKAKVLSDLKEDGLWSQLLPLN